MAELRVNDLNESVTEEEMTRVIAVLAECRQARVHYGMI